MKLIISVFSTEGIIKKINKPTQPNHRYKNRSRSNLKKKWLWPDNDNSWSWTIKKPRIDKLIEN